MLVTSSSPIEVSKVFFAGVKFRAKFEVVLQKQQSVVGNHSKLSFSTVIGAAEGEKILYMYST